MNKKYYVSSNSNAYTEKSLFVRICPFSQSQSHIVEVFFYLLFLSFFALGGVLLFVAVVVFAMFLPIYFVL